MTRHEGARGFTLIEMCMTVAIAGILAALAIQSYELAGAKSKRSAGLVALKTVSLRQASYFSERGTFAPTLDALGFDVLGVQRLTPTSAKWGSYIIEIGSADATNYYAAATAQIDRDPFTDVIGVNRGNPPHVIFDDVTNTYSAMPDPVIPPAFDGGGGGGGGSTTGGSTSGGNSGGGNSGGGNSGGGNSGGGNSGGGNSGGGNSGGGNSGGGGSTSGGSTSGGSTSGGSTSGGSSSGGSTSGGSTTGGSTSGGSTSGGSTSGGSTSGGSTSGGSRGRR